MNKMKPLFFMMLILALVMVMVIPGAAFSQGEQERLDTSAFEKPRRPGAIFAHDDHNEKANLEDDCAICHHVYANKQLVPDESSEEDACSDCHGLKSSLENNIPLVRAFHGRCRECHFDSGKGPVLCGQCHIKK